MLKFLVVDKKGQKTASTSGDFRCVEPWSSACLLLLN